jgi:hypothetical protein
LFAEEPLETREYINIQQDVDKKANDLKILAVKNNSPVFIDGHHSNTRRSFCFPTNHNITNDIIAKKGCINLNEMSYLNNNYRNKKLTERTHVSTDVFSTWHEHHQFKKISTCHEHHQ